MAKTKLVKKYLVVFAAPSGIYSGPSFMSDVIEASNKAEAIDIAMNDDEYEDLDPIHIEELN